MLWSMRTSRRMAAAVWPLRSQDADVQRSASPSGSGRRPRGRRQPRRWQPKFGIVVGRLVICITVVVFQPKRWQSNSLVSLVQRIPCIKRCRPSAACTSLRHPNLCAATLTYAQMNDMGSGGGEAVLAPNTGGGEPRSSVKRILPADSIKESTRGTIKIWPEQAITRPVSTPRPPPCLQHNAPCHTCRAHWHDRWHAPCFAGGGHQGGR